MKKIWNNLTRNDIVQILKIMKPMQKVHINFNSTKE